MRAPLHYRFATGAVVDSVSTMPSTAELVKLPVAERIALIDELWASIGEEDLPVEPAQVNEARTRWQELKANPSLGLSYDELKARLG
ncbi:MAG: addiction module protein [Verrucomicrobia bacterium]|nr:addiction module protein [Verrucomicrobiota bacterium]